MLTKIQSKNLIKKDSLDKVTKAKYEYLAVKKLENALDTLRDAEIVLNNIPKNKLQKYLKDEHVERLLKLSSLLMLKLDFNKVRSIDDKTLFVYLEDENHHIETVEPSKRDLQRSKMLYERLFDLEAFVDATLLDRGVEIPGYKVPNHLPGWTFDVYEKVQRRALDNPSK